MKKSSGITLVEILMVIGTISLIVLSVSLIFVLGWKNFNEEVTTTQLQSEIKYVSQILLKEIRGADQVLESYIFWIGDNCTENHISHSGFPLLYEKTYAQEQCTKTVLYSGPESLVLSSPALDQNLSPLPTLKNHEVILRDTQNPAQLKIIKVEWNSQLNTYLRKEKVISQNVESIKFSYLPSEQSITEAKSVKIEITVAKTVRNRTFRSGLTSQVMLRNKQ